MINCPLPGVAGCTSVAINGYNVKLENCNGNTKGSIGYRITGLLGLTYNWERWQNGVKVESGTVSMTTPHLTNNKLGIADLGDSFEYKNAIVYQLRIQGAGCTFCNNPGVPPPCPSPSPTSTPSVTSTPSITPSRTITPSVTRSITPTRTPSKTVTPSVTPTITPTTSSTPSKTPSRTASITPSITPTKSPTRTPSISSSITPSITPSRTSSRTPSVSITPSITPTKSPSKTPSVTPSITPSNTPSSTPSISVSATVTPSVTSSISVSITPSITPSKTPTKSITPSSSITPSITSSPSISISPTKSPSKTPSTTPSISISPTRTPSITPSKSVSVTPTSSITPSRTSSVTPSITSSVTKSVTPTMSKSVSKTPTPSITVSPSKTASVTPTPTPSTSTGCVVTTTNDVFLQLNCSPYDNTLRAGLNFKNILSSNACNCGFLGGIRIQSYESINGNAPSRVSTQYPSAICTLNTHYGGLNICTTPVGTEITFSYTWEIENSNMPVSGPTAGSGSITYTVTQQDKNSCSNCPVPPSPSRTPSITPSSTPPREEGIPCGGANDNLLPSAYPGKVEVNTGPATGISKFYFKAGAVPDRYIIVQNGVIYDSGYRGDQEMYDYGKPKRVLFTQGLYGQIDPILNQAYPILPPPNNTIAPDGYPYVGRSIGTMDINKTETGSKVLITYYSSIIGAGSQTSIGIRFDCPNPNISPSATPSITVSPTPSISSNFIGNTPEGAIRCGSGFSSQESRTRNYNVFVGNGTGIFKADINVLTIPTAFVITYNGLVRSVSQFYGSSDYNYGGLLRDSWINIMSGKTIPGTTTTYPILPPTNDIAPDGYPYILFTEGSVIYNKQDSDANIINITTFGNEDIYNYFTIDSNCLGSYPSVSATRSVTPTITPSRSITPTVTASISVSVTPTATVTSSVTPTSSITPTITATSSVTPSITPSETPSISITPTPSGTPGESVTPTPTTTPSISVSPSITPTASITPSISITGSVTPTASITPTRTVTPTRTASITPTRSATPSRTPSLTPTPSPSTIVCDPYGTFISSLGCTGTCNEASQLLADGNCSSFVDTYTDMGCTSGCCPTAGSIVGTITCTACQQSTHLIANGSCGSTPSPFYDSFCTDNDLCCPGCGLAGCDGNFDCCDCYGDVCGTDNCGNSCGTCGGGTSCVSGQCCEPYGTPLYTECNGCETTRSWFADGSCGASFIDVFTPGECTGAINGCCEPDCAGKSCGDDGCGGSCGDCIQGSQDCDFNTGQCIWINECDPPCTGECEQCQGTVCATIC